MIKCVYRLGMVEIIREENYALYDYELGYIPPCNLTVSTELCNILKGLKCEKLNEEINSPRVVFLLVIYIL